MSAEDRSTRETLLRWGLVAVFLPILICLVVGPMILGFAGGLYAASWVETTLVHPYFGGHYPALSSALHVVLPVASTAVGFKLGSGLWSGAPRERISKYQVGMQQGNEGGFL